MIYSRFGGQLEIIEYTGQGWCKVKRLSDGAIREWHISEFKADFGSPEIMEAVKKADINNIKDYNT